MLVQFSTDQHVDGGADLEAATVERVTKILDRFEDQLTRVEIRLSDENSGAKEGATDIRCTIEARVTSRQPIVVHHDDDTPPQAADGAARKMRRALDSALGKAGRR